MPYLPANRLMLDFAAIPQAEEQARIAYQLMLLSRVLEAKIASLYRAGKIAGGVYLGTGQEALSVSLGLFLNSNDIYAPLIRDQAGRLAFGETPQDALRSYLGSKLGMSRSRDGNVHRGRPLEGYLTMISHLGAMISVVNGALMARRFQGIHGTVGATCIGEGGTSTGAFHEGLNQACVEKLPLVVVVANNHYAYSTPTIRQFGCASLLERCRSYGLEARQIDGTDLLACLEALGHAVAQARAGRGPQVVIGELLRLCGHGEHDDAKYVEPSLRESTAGRDCLKVAEETLLKNQWVSQSDLECWGELAREQVEAATAAVLQEPGPHADSEEWCALSTRWLQDGAGRR